MTVLAEMTTADLLLDWDHRRPRSQQTAFGMSELGDCRRRAGYRLARVEPTNAGGSVQAVMGTAIHSAVATVLKDLQAEGVIPADALVEHEVHFAGIIGHLDLFVEPELTDTKTTSSRWLNKLKVNGPTLPHLWQIHGYGAGLIAEGRKVRKVIIDYLARDTGEQWRWSGKFEPKHVKDALSWVTQVRNTDLDDLPRDHDPDGPFCQHCPFFDICWDGYITGRDPRSVLYVEDPDAAKWARQLQKGRGLEAAGKKLSAEAKGALDALRPDEPADVRIPGFEKLLRFTVTEPKRTDIQQVKRDYKAAGRPVPLKSPKAEVKLELVAPEVSDAAS
jgi:hypothetical protein